VQVVLAGKDSQEIHLATLRSGEFFGEMALFQQQPRSATVIAREACSLLEIKGEKFLRLASQHPDIEFRVLLTLSERLRHTNEQVLAFHLKDVDEKLTLFNLKLDTELRVVDASMKAAQTVFDQTKLRADEVINSAERSRTRITTALTAIGSVVTVGIALFGFLGIKEILDIRKELSIVVEMKGQVRKHADDVKKLIKDTTDLFRDFEANRHLIDRARDNVSALLDLPDIPNLLRDRNKIHQAVERYDDLRQAKSDDPYLRLLLLDEIADHIITQRGGNRIDYTELLGKILEDARTPERKMTAYFLLLTNAILLDPPMKIFENGKTFDTTLAEFRKYVRDNKDTRFPKRVVDPIKRLLDQESPEVQKRFQPIKDLISTR